MKPRYYQQECLEAIENSSFKSDMAILATGTGKSFIMSKIPFKKRLLWLSHREELVLNPLEYYDFPVGIEKAKLRHNSEQVISASVQSLARRLGDYPTDFFDTILTDECVHAVGSQYKAIYDHFNCTRHIGFTACPNRLDNKGLDQVYENIVYEYPFQQAIQEGFLCPIKCFRADIGYNLSQVASRMGDFAQKDLEKAVNIEGANQAVYEALQKFGKYPAIVFCVSVAHAEAMAELIPDAIAVSAKTKNRADIISRARAGEIPVICNVGVYTEGTNIPNLRTVLIARPTQSLGLYCLDEDTEILTGTGWKKDININEKVAVFNTKTEEIKFEKVENTIRRKLYKDEFFCSIKGVSTDIRVTNKHKIIYDNKRKKGWKIQNAEYITNLKDGCYIPMAGYKKQNGVPLTEDELSFIGWVMTDGCISKYTKAITITQSSNQPWIEKIQKAIDGCNFKNTRKEITRNTNFKNNVKTTIWTISYGKPRPKDENKTGWKHLEPWLDKDFSIYLMQCTQKQLDILLEAIHLGDGSKQKNQTWTRRSYHIATINKTFAERLQICCIMNGYRANISTNINKNGNEILFVRIKKQNWSHIGSTYDSRPQWIKEKHTDGKCWCITTKTGTIITRRNGKVAIMGNCQMVGRGTRLFEGKNEMTLIDCVGNTGKHDLCTAPSLLGYDLDEVPKAMQKEIIGDLLEELPQLIEEKSDTVETWIKNIYIVELYAKKNSWNFHRINWQKQPDGSMLIFLLDNKWMHLKAPNHLGNTVITSSRGKVSDQMPMQKAVDLVFKTLKEHFKDEEFIWSTIPVKRWGKSLASDKQRRYLNALLKKHPKVDFNTQGVTKQEASCIINRLKLCDMEMR